MKKVKILISGLNLDGKQLKKGSTEELPWQIAYNWAARGWVKLIEEAPKGGDKGGLQDKTGSGTDAGAGDTSGS